MRTIYKKENQINKFLTVTLLASFVCTLEIAATGIIKNLFKLLIQILHFVTHVELNLST